MNWTETRARLIECGISAARLPEEWQPDIDLRADTLTGADLTRANLTGANLTRADLTRANLTWADLTRANLTWADLTRANLTGANLTGANLTGADLTGADLTRANLTRADLTRANLTGADLTGADLTRANLTGADLTWANLTGSHLAGIVVAWQSHALLADILRRAAGDNVPRRMLAGLIAISTDWCWGKFLNLDIDPALREWAIAELRQWVRDSDAAPDALRATPPAA